ncbi:MAG: hypothetical protein ACOC56_03520 [Atribacterota bacterium]
MHTFTWFEFSQKEAKDVDHAAFQVCYQSDTQSLLLLFNYIDLENYKGYWEWHLILNNQCGKNIIRRIDIERMNPPYEWANKCIKNLQNKTSQADHVASEY